MDSVGTHESGDLHLHIAEDRPLSERRRATTYLDTTIPSYLVSKLSGDIRIARNQRITRIWWRRYSARHVLYISERVLLEARSGRKIAAVARLQALEAIPALARVERAEALAAELVGAGLLPSRAWADAEHIAIAATHGMRFLLTWNCKHLANANISRNVVQMCEKYGVECPEICTPEKLMRAYANEKSTH